MAAFSFLSPFDKLTEEHQEAMLESVLEIQDSVNVGGHITNLLSNMDGRLADLVTINSAILMQLGGAPPKLISDGNSVTKAVTDGSGLGASVGASPGQILALGVTAPLFGIGLQVILSAVKKHQDIDPDAFDKIIGGIDKFAEVVEKLEPAVEMMKEIPAFLLKMSAAIILFGLSLIVAAPLYMIGIFAMPLIAFTIGGFIWILRKMNPDEDSGKGVLKGAKGLLFMAAAILLFGVALVVAGKLYQHLVNAQTIITILVIFAFMALFALLGMLIDGGAIEKGGRGLMFMGAAILLFAIALLLTAKLVMFMWEKGMFFTIVGVILGVLAFMYLIGYAVDGGNVEKGGKGLMYMAAGILLFSLALFFSAKLLPSFMEMVYIALAIGGFGLVFVILGNGAKLIKKGAIAMLTVGVALIVMSLGIFIMAKALPDMKTALGILGIILGLGVVFGIAGAGPVPGFILAGAAAMVVVGVALVIIGAGVAIMSSAIKGLKTEQLLQMGAIILGLGLGFAGLGLAAPFIALGAGAMLIAGVATAAVGTGLKILTGIDFKKLGNINKKGAGPFNFSGEMTKGFLGMFKRKKTNFEVAVEAIVDGVSLGPLSIIGVYAGAPAILIAGRSLSSIAKGLLDFQEMSKGINVKKLSGNIKFTLAVVSSAFADIGRQTKKAGGLRGLLGGGTNPVAEGIKSVKGMGKVLSNLAEGIQAWADLKYAVYYNEDGSVGEYRSITTDDMKTVTANIKMVLRTLNVVFQELGESNGNTNWFRKGKIEKGVKAIQGVGSELGGIATAVQDWANLTYTVYDDKGEEIKRNMTQADLDGAIIRMKSVIHSLTSVLGEIGGNPDAKRKWWGGKSKIDKGIAIIKKINGSIGNIAEFIKGVAEMKDAPAGTIKKVLLAIPDAVTAVHDKLEGKIDKMIESMEAINKFTPPLNKLAQAAKSHNKTFKENKDFGTNVKKVLGGMADAVNHWFKKTGEGDFVPLLFLKVAMDIVVQPIRFLANAVERYGAALKEHKDFGKNLFGILSKKGTMSHAIMMWYKLMEEGNYGIPAFFAWSWTVLVKPIRMLANAIERYGQVLRDHIDFGENFNIIITPLSDSIGGMAKKVNMEDVIITRAMAAGALQATKLMAKAGMHAFLFQLPLYYFTDTAWPKILRVLTESAIVFKDVEKYVTPKTANQYGSAIGILVNFMVQSAIMLGLLKGGKLIRMTDSYIPKINNALRITSITFKKFGRDLKPNTGRNVGLAVLAMMTGLSAAFQVKWSWKERRRFRMTVNIIKDFAEDWKNMEKAADAMERIADAQVKWTKAINDLDPELLTETRQMFDSFAILASTRSVERIIDRFGSSMEEALTRLADYIMALAEQMPSAGGGLPGGEGAGGGLPGGLPNPFKSGGDFKPPKKDKTASEVRNLAGLLKQINTTLKGKIKVDAGRGGI